jgi:translation initiation factor 2 gamma subunit (eIF-2gamma)
MAHELTHVVQQRSMSGGGGMSVGAAGDPHETHADSMADAVLSKSAAPAQAKHDMNAQRAEDDEEIGAKHDLSVQREEEQEEIGAQHDLSVQREEATEDDIP